VIRLGIIGLLLVDLPFALAVALLGMVYGFREVGTAYLDWREAHPWSYLVSVAMVMGFVVWSSQRKRRAQRLPRAAPQAVPVRSRRGT
jgi:hypothetical protein